MREPDGEAAQHGSATPSACQPWQNVCTSPKDPGGPCTSKTMPPWRTSVEIQRLDLPQDDCEQKQCLLTILRISVALFEQGAPLGLANSSGNRALETFVGAILDISLSDVNGKADSASAAEFVDLKHLPLPWLSIDTDRQSPRFEPLFRTARRASFLLAPMPTLFQDVNESLAGIYTVYIGLTRPTEAPFPCVGLTLDRVRLSAKRQEGDPESAVHRFPYHLFAQAKEKPDHRQYIEEVTLTLIYTPPEGWMLDPAAGHEIHLRNSVQAGSPSLAVRDDGTLAVQGAARSRYWADAPIANVRLQNGQIEADVMVHLRRRENSASYIADTLLLQRLDICCCPRQVERAEDGPSLKLDVSRHAIVMPAVDGEPVSEAEALRSAATILAELRRIAAGAHREP